MIDNQVRIGVIGVGHLGQHHVKHYKTLDNVGLIGVFDINQPAAEAIASEFNVSSFKKLEELLSQCDGVSIATPAFSHYDIGKLALNNMCHIFMEKPITISVNTAQELINIAEKNSLLIQVGHIERFNPALIGFINNHGQCNPSIIEAHRLSPFNVRGTDTDVILDLMIHDIDLILYFINSSITNIEASGVSILSENLDLVNARITFKNKAVANLTASRMSDKPLRKLRLFETNQYISIDLQKHQYSQYQVQKDDGIPHDDSVFKLDNKLVTLKHHQAKKTNALYEELLLFINHALFYFIA